jgi:DNA-binding XRE family transcriptional regulator
MIFAMCEFSEYPFRSKDQLGAIFLIPSSNHITGGLEIRYPRELALTTCIQKGDSRLLGLTVSGLTVQKTDLNRIRAYRIQRKISLADLGKALGIGRTEMLRIETGESQVSFAQLDSIATALGIAVDDLSRT